MLYILCLNIYNEKILYICIKKNVLLILKNDLLFESK